MAEQLFKMLHNVAIPTSSFFLLERGANCNASAADSKGATALQAAAIGGNLQITFMLLKAGADINAAAAESNGRSALETAAEHGRLDIVSLLLKNTPMLVDWNADARTRQS